MNALMLRTLTLTIALSMAMVACSGDDGEDYNEYGQLIKKTDVHVVSVDLGRAVDVGGHLTDATDIFAPTDTVYASVRTKGSSPSTVLGVRWKNAMGDEINGNNLVVRPTGDTATLFALRYPVALDPGRYTLETRVNGGVVKTSSFTVSSTAEPHRASPEEVVEDRQRRSLPTFLYKRSMFSRVRDMIAGLFDRAAGDESPFEWRGLRAGMRFSRLDRLSKPASAWTCTPFMLSAVGLQRATATSGNDLGWGRVHVMVDTVGQRVVSIEFGVDWVYGDTAGRVVFEHEMDTLADKWDRMPGVIRNPTRAPQGQSYARWVTPDSLWSAMISYSQGTHQSSPRANSFKIEEIHWGDSVAARVTDSLKGQMRNPESEYYRTPNTACNALDLDSR
jgi:hypothetical protein